MTSYEKKIELNSTLSVWKNKKQINPYTNVLMRTLTLIGLFITVEAMQIIMINDNSLHKIICPVMHYLLWNFCSILLSIIKFIKWIHSLFIIKNLLNYLLFFYWYLFIKFLNYYLFIILTKILLNEFY